MHTDAVQSAGKIPVDVRALGVDLLSLSAHKFNGPKGAGALWIKRGTRMQPILTGGKHERNRRAGTENVPAIAGMGVAARLARGKIDDRRRARRRRCAIGSKPASCSGVPGTAVNGDAVARVPNTTNISFDRVEAESLLIALDLEGDRRLDRIGVLVGNARAVARAARDGVPGAPDAELAALQPRTLLDRGGGRSRHRGAAAAGGEAARLDAESWLATPYTKPNTRHSYRDFVPRTSVPP